VTVAMHRARHIRMMLRMLLLGLALTVIFAWLCAWFVPLDNVRSATTTGTGARIVTRQSLGTRQIDVQTSVYGFPTLPRSFVRAPPPDKRCVTGGAGWPWKALEWRCEFDTNAALGPPTFPVIPPAAGPTLDAGLCPRGIASVDFTGDTLRGILPLRPIWRGLLGDVAVLGAGTWCVVWIATALRRARRSRKSLCSRCGYNLTGLLEMRCPECGWHGSGPAARRDRLTGRLAALVVFVAIGAGATLATSWLISLFAGYDPARVRNARLSDAIEPWLLRRYDAFGSTRLAWLDNSAEAEEVKSELRARQRLIDRQARGEPEMTVARVEKIIEARRARLLERRGPITDTINPSFVPPWFTAPAPVEGSAITLLSIVQDARGWPMRAMWCEFQSTASGTQAIVGGFCGNVSGGISVGDASTRTLAHATALPLRILWPGFLVDSALFAGASALLWHLCSRCVRRRYASFASAAAPRTRLS
jgi:hypothetical protein